MKRSLPIREGQAVEYHPRGDQGVQWDTKVKANVWTAAPRSSHWWVRVGQTTVEVYRRADHWVESPTQGEPAKPRVRKVKPPPAGSVPLFAVHAILTAHRGVEQR